MIININHNKERIGINDLVFEGGIVLHSDKVTMNPHVTTLEIDSDVDVRMLIYGKLEDLKLYGDDKDFEITNISIIDNNGSYYYACESVLQRYQYMDFLSLGTITKETYRRIADVVHANDRKARYIELIHNVIDNIDDDEIAASIERFLSDPKPEYIDFVEDEINEYITGEDEETVVRRLIQRFKGDR